MKKIFLFTLCILSLNAYAGKILPGLPSPLFIDPTCRGTNLFNLATGSCLTGGGGPPGGISTSIQTNNGSGGLAGDSNFTYDGSLGIFNLNGATNGSNFNFNDQTQQITASLDDGFSVGSIAFAAGSITIPPSTNDFTADASSYTGTSNDTYTVTVTQLNAARVQYGSPNSGTFLIGETVTASPSGATCVIAVIITNTFACSSSSGTFSFPDVITGGTSGATGTIERGLQPVGTDIVTWSDTQSNSGITFTPSGSATFDMSNGVTGTFSFGGVTRNVGDQWVFSVTEQFLTLFDVDLLDELVTLGDINHLNNGTTLIVDDADQEVIVNARLNMGGNLIQEIADPSSMHDAVNLEYYNAHLPRVPGSIVNTLNSLTGNLSITNGANIAVTPSGSNIQIAVDISGTPHSSVLFNDAGIIGGSSAMDWNGVDTLTWGSTGTLLSNSSGTSIGDSAGGRLLLSNAGTTQLFDSFGLELETDGNGTVEIPHEILVDGELRALGSIVFGDHGIFNSSGGFAQLENSTSSAGVSLPDAGGASLHVQLGKGLTIATTTGNATFSGTVSATNLITSVTGGTPNLVNSSTSVGPIAFCTGDGSMYRVSAYVVDSAASVSGGTVTVALNWNDAVQAQTNSTFIVNALTTLGIHSSADMVMQVSNATNVTYTTTVAGVITGTPTYNLNISCEKVF